MTADSETDPGEIGFVAVGKQVLIDGNLHYADAVDPQAAEIIAEALNERRRRIIAEAAVRCWRCGWEQAKCTCNWGDV